MHPHSTKTIIMIYVQINNNNIEVTHQLQLPKNITATQYLFPWYVGSFRQPVNGEIFGRMLVSFWAYYPLKFMTFTTKNVSTVFETYRDDLPEEYAFDGIQAWYPKTKDDFYAKDVNTMLKGLVVTNKKKYSLIYLFFFK